MLCLRVTGRTHKQTSPTSLAVSVAWLRTMDTVTQPAVGPNAYTHAIARGNGRVEIHAMCLSGIVNGNGV